jgi:hypothetical protein
MARATSSRPRASRRERIINYLSSQGGRVDSVDGRGLTSKMATKVGYDNIAALNAILARLERDGEIKRDVRGKRTYSIALRRRAARASRGKGEVKKARTPIRKVGRPAPASGPRRTSPGSGSRQGRSESRRATTAGSNLPQLLAALGNELLALREQNEEMSRRIAALEAAARPASRRASGRRAA